MLTSIPCTVMRGGTSKGLYFHERDLPSDRELRDRVLLAAMGSPDARQIDGMGGGHPLTSKVAVIKKSTRPNVDVDYLFLQVVVGKAEVSDSQNCGNILAGVGPWAIEQGLVPISGATTPVRIHMVNTDSAAVAYVATPDGTVEYEGDARIDGVPGTAAPVRLEFLDIAGSSCGSMLPTGRARDRIDDIEVTCIDNGMPVVLLRASDFGLEGDETPEQLESNTDLKTRIEQIRLKLGGPMNLGDVLKKTVPKMCLISAPRSGGSIATRTFIPHRVHESIGVLGAVSVATACALPGSIAAEIAQLKSDGPAQRIDVEHPTGFFTVDLELRKEADAVSVQRASLLRTSRLLMRGEVFVPKKVWSR
ncbi:MAG TPA: 4-oxalomesaconate tautomerase [Steroidobacteraceae bacterium]|nr:4-oxalomesaconate tautomerase [Steroidobacteraceae bacterium]